MIYRSTSKNGGCFLLIVFAIILILIVRFTGFLLFRTALGPILLIYILYRYYKRTRNIKKNHTTYKEENVEEHDVDIEVDYEEYE